MIHYLSDKSYTPSYFD